MSRLMITGASGLLGSNLVLEAMDHYTVIAVCHQHPISHRGLTVEVADLSKASVVDHLIAKYQPDALIHCAAATDVDRCETDPDWAFRLNRDMPRSLAQAVRANNTRMIHISTDAVFDGEKGDYSEQDPPSPINVYGKSKAEGEHCVLEEHPTALVVRTNMFGWSAQGKNSLVEWFLKQFEAGQTCPGFVDVWVNSLYVQDLAEILLKLLSMDVSGLLHVPGRDCLSKYELGRSAAQVFGYKPDLVQPISVREAGLRAARPGNLCLSGEKYRSMVDGLWPGIQSGLKRMLDFRDSGQVYILKGMLGDPDNVPTDR